jgi:DinB family protein
MPPATTSPDIAPAFRHQLIGRLRQHAGDVRRITDGLGDAALQRRIEPEQWSLTELVCHLLRIQHLFEGRIDAMLERDEPAFESYAPESDADFVDFVASHPGRKAVEAFLTERNRFADRLDALAPGQWRRRGRHPTFATFDVDFLVEYLLHHEAHHVYQMFTRRIRVAA